MQQNLTTSFTENGLPSNALWQVSYSGVTENALAPNAIIFTTAPGNYMFSVANVPLSNTNTFYVPNQSSGYLVAGNTTQIAFSLELTVSHGSFRGIVRPAGKHADVAMHNAVLHGIAINLSTDLSFNIGVSIKAATNPNFYEQIDINETNVTLGNAQLQPASIDEFVKSATYNFSVPISWVQSHGVSNGNIKLFKYVSGSWLALPTAYIGSNSTDYFYSAVSNSLSTYAVGYVSGNTVGKATPLSLTLPSGYTTYFFSYGGVSGNAAKKIVGSKFSDNWTTGTNYTSTVNFGPNKKQYNMTNIGYSTAGTGTVSGGTNPINISLTGIGANVILANGKAFYSSTASKSGSLSYSVATSNSFVILLFASGGSYFSSAPNTTASGCSTVQSVSEGTLASSAIMVCNALSAGSYTASAATSKYSSISIAAYVFPPYTVTLDDAPSTGNIVLGGTTYTNGQAAAIIGSTTLNAIIPSGYTFNSWIASNSNVTIANTLSTNTIVTVEGNSIITAYSTFPCTPSSSPPSSVPANVEEYVPVTICNEQASTAPSTFQQMLTVNSLAYQAYEANNLDNIEFFFSNGTIVPSWLESGNSNTATNTIYWLKLPGNFLPASSSNTLYMGFASTSTNLFSPSGKTGEAPQLSSTYAQYDDGASVFTNYWDFAGTSLPSGISSITSNGIVTVNNGVNIKGATSATGGENGVYTTSSISPNVIVDYYGTQSTSPSGDSWGWNMVGFSNYISTSDHHPAQGGTYTLLDYEGGINAKPETDQGYSTVTNGALSAPSSNLFPASVWTQIYTPSSYYTYQNYENNTGYITGASNTASLPFIIMVGNNEASYAPNGMTVYYLRVRAYPPNGVMPSVSFGSVTAVSVPTTCTISLSPNSVSFGTMYPGTSIGTTEPVTVSNSGSSAANILVYGANWISGTTSFGVSNTTWAASNNVPWSSANQLTAVATATGLIAPASGSNTIYLGLRIPGGAPPYQYSQNIIIENSC